MKLSPSIRLLIAALVCALLVVLFFFEFLVDVDRFVASDHWLRSDWARDRSTYANIEHQAFENLVAVREMKANQIEDYVGHITDQILTLAESRMIVDAMEDLRRGFDAIDDESALDPGEAELLGQLPPQGGQMVLVGLQPAAGKGPHRAGGELEAHEQHVGVGGDDDAAHRRTDPEFGHRHSSGVSRRPSLNAL